MNQPLPLLDQLISLAQLQELDIKIDSIKKSQSSLPAGLRTIDDALKKAKVTFDAKSNQIAELEKVNRQTQAAIDLNQDRMSRSTTKLETVQNTQEFQAASKEIEQLKKLHLNLEEQKKKLTGEIESLQKDFNSLQAQVEKLEADRGSQSNTLSGQNQAFLTDLNQLFSDRAKYLPLVELRLLAQYDRIRAARGGVGIVPAIAGRCKACNMIVPPQLYNELQRGTALHSCPSCNRILFVPSVPKDTVLDEPQVVNG